MPSLSPLVLDEPEDLAPSTPVIFSPLIPLLPAVVAAPPGPVPSRPTMADPPPDTRPGMVLRVDAAAEQMRAFNIGTPPPTPSSRDAGRGVRPGNLMAPFRLAGGGEGSDSKSKGNWSPSLPPIGAPPSRSDTDEDLMRKAVLWEIDPMELEFVGSVKLGAGAYGEVVRALWRGTPVAVKKVHSIGATTDEAAAELRHEIAVMSHMHHPRVVQFLGACTRQLPWFIVFEYLPGGALSTLLEKRDGRPLPHALAARFALDAAQSLRYLHEHKPTAVVHRDLKPSNLVVDASGHLKITDFGLAKVVDMIKHKGSDAYVMTGETGSYRYMSPEVYRHEKYDEKVDIYALGMIMYYMWHGEPPFASMPPLDAVRKAAQEGARPQLRVGVPKPVSDLIKACWHPDPSLRPSALEVCRTLDKIVPVELDPLRLESALCAPGRCSLQ
jgi:tRNA A-37 threonylcarbamoyl transferase component Bud32